MRKLVTIRKVLEIKDIEGADKIELAVIGGWQCVVSKGDFKIGDLALYFEIDSMLPLKEPFMFLKDRCYKKLPDGTEGLRLKTIRLKGKYSQGLLLPLDKFPELDFTDTKKDYSEELGVFKYEPPIPANMNGKVKGSFPTHLVPKTDQERIQNLPEYFTEYKDMPFEKSLKYDGSSMTIIHHSESERPLMVCSRNLELDLDDNSTFIQVFNNTGLKEKLPLLCRNIAIQGELVGEGIQKNPLGIKGHEFYVFDMYDIDKQEYLSCQERAKLTVELGLNHVTLIDTEDYPLRTSMNEVLKDAEDALYGDRKGEGYVYKSIVNPSISFKAINNKYLLKGD